MFARINFVFGALSKASSYYIPVIVYNKYLTVKRLFRWQTTDDGLVLNSAAVAIKYHFRNAISFSRGLFYLEECFVNYLLPAPSNLTNLERLVA